MLTLATGCAAHGNMQARYLDWLQQHRFCYCNTSGTLGLFQESETLLSTAIHVIKFDSAVVHTKLSHLLKS